MVASQPSAASRLERVAPWLRHQAGAKVCREARDTARRPQRRVGC